MSDIIIFDLDGTVCDCTHRLKYLETKPKDWDSFYGAVGQDEPITQSVELLKLLLPRYRIIFLSGRRESCRDDTNKWLKRYGLHNYYILQLRKDGDFRPDTIVKKEFYEDNIKPFWKPFLVFEDRASVVEMWRGLGLVCYQVAEGKF